MIPIASSSVHLRHRQLTRNRQFSQTVSPKKDIAYTQVIVVTKQHMLVADGSDKAGRSRVYVAVRAAVVTPTTSSSVHLRHPQRTLNRQFSIMFSKTVSSQEAVDAPPPRPTQAAVIVAKKRGTHLVAGLSIKACRWRVSVVI